MEPRHVKRRIRTTNPRRPTQQADLDAKTDHFMDKFKETIQELFPKPAEQPGWTMPGVACFTVTACVNSEQQDLSPLAGTPLYVPRVSAAVAEQAAAFCRYLAMELRPGESLTVTVERHEDVPFNQAAPVVMPR